MSTSTNALAQQSSPLADKVATIVQAAQRSAHARCEWFSTLLNCPMTVGHTIGFLCGSALVSASIAVGLLVHFATGWAILLVAAGIKSMLPAVIQFKKEGGAE